MPPARLTRGTAGWSQPWGKVVFIRSWIVELLISQDHRPVSARGRLTRQ